MFFFFFFRKYSRMIRICAGNNNFNLKPSNRNFFSFISFLRPGFENRIFLKERNVRSISSYIYFSCIFSLSNLCTSSFDFMRFPFSSFDSVCVCSESAKSLLNLKMYLFQYKKFLTISSVAYFTARGVR